MAYKTQRGDWRGSVMLDGVRRTQAGFDGRRAAEAWELGQRAHAAHATAGTLGRVTTLRAVLERYALEVAPTHKGHAYEVKRIRAWLRGVALPLDKPIAEVTTAHLQAWVAARGRTVAAGSVLRDTSLMSSVLAWARRDWRLINTSPLADVRKPREPAHRERVVNWREVRAVLRLLGHRPLGRVETTSQIVACAVLLALRTGMRQGELTAVQWADVRAHSLVLRDTKNGDAREVPLSAKALRVVAKLRHHRQLIDATAGVVSATFKRQTGRLAFAPGFAYLATNRFTFHDLRHTAATRIGATVGQPGRLTVLEMCKVFGWRDPKKALVYVNPTAAQLADKM